ncbi:lamin tail domain-containing protein [Akkermansiaceae bacterium]|nr:lamin tail domain-containing protein [Akkermansiaceae bacterium]MDB4544371.1 lamin tail domain-containing protein [Akkermansiaceae bacterium]
MLKISPLLSVATFLTASSLWADVVINEIVATAADRNLRWDDNEQPYAGAGPAWWSPSFDDGDWDSGNLPMGYSISPLSTNLFSKLSNVSPSFYVRKDFNASASEAGSGQPLILSINYNDGFIAWVNGVEVARANMGEDKAHIFHDQVSYRASGLTTGTQDFTLGIASDLLSEGENLIAIQVNNSTINGNMRLDVSLRIDEAGVDPVLVAAGSMVSYLPGLREPGANLFEPALLDVPALDNDSSDWIELYNSGPGVVSLNGWTLTDDEAEKDQWVFPNGTTIGAGEYLIVMADDPDSPIPGAQYLHANFKLSSSGDFVGLYDDGGGLVSSIVPSFPKQFYNYSYGHDGEGGLAYFETPTPGGPNRSGLIDKVDAPDFDNKGGFYDGPITVTLTSQTPGASIRYTTDGTEPTLTNGNDYTIPLSLSIVTNRKGHVIRARAFLEDYIPSNVKTHTFLIQQDVRLRTSPSLVYAGDPQRSLYDPFGVMAINGGTYTSSQWSPTGIADYNNVINRGQAYERLIHAEFYFPDGTVGFRTDVGLRVAASSYSRPRMQLTQTSASPWPAQPVQKPSFNLYFRDEYGNPSVNLPFNGPDRGVNNYERFRVRAGKNDILNPWVIDELVRRLSRDMGNGASVGVVNSLYVNGELKGFYNMVERLREPLFRSLHSEDNNAQWDVLQFEGNDNVAEGDKVAWNNMISRLNAATNVTNWEQVLEVADVVNMADYYLLNIYGATWDWPHNNWVAAKERSPEGRYRLYVWDAEGAFNNKGNRPVSQEMIQTYIATGSGELRDLWRGLNRWEEFRILFADRINKHMFNGGVLDDRNYASSHLKGELDQLVTEFSDLLSVMNSQTVNVSKPANWASPTTGRRRYLFGPVREDFRDKNLWPETLPPEFSQFGGTVARGSSLKVTNDSGLIYYTTDGTDPRLPGGGVNPAAVSQVGSILDVEMIPIESVWSYSDEDGDLGTAWRTGLAVDDAWQTGAGPLGYGSVKDGLVEIDIATEVNNPSPRQPITYFRKEFEIDDAAAYLELTMKVRADAGPIVYLNGVKAFQDTNIPEGATYGTLPTSDASDSNEGDLDEYSLDPALLVSGTNVIAVEHYNSPTSSDMVFDLQLEGRRTNPANTPLPIDGAITVMARSYDDGEWSALTAADFTVETLVPSSANLAIVEMLYNPVGPTEAEVISGYDDGDLFEFIRIQNTGLGTVDLGQVRFTQGISFDFADSDIRILPYGSAVLLVSKLDAFRARFGNDYDDIIAGEYSGQLSNGGETIRFVGGDNSLIHEFTYGTSAPWPDLTLMDGHSIQLLDASVSHDDGSNWRASGSVDGDLQNALGFDAWRYSFFTATGMDDQSVSGPHADPDGDGWSNYLEYALGTFPQNSGDFPAAVLPSMEDHGGDLYLTITYTRSVNAGAVQFSAETSEDLENWIGDGIPITPEVTHPDGSITAKFRHPIPVGDGSQYLRLKVSE